MRPLFCHQRATRMHYSVPEHILAPTKHVTRPVRTITRSSFSYTYTHVRQTHSLSHTHKQLQHADNFFYTLPSSYSPMSPTTTIRTNTSSSTQPPHILVQTNLISFYRQQTLVKPPTQNTLTCTSATQKHMHVHT